MVSLARFLLSIASPRTTKKINVTAPKKQRDEYGRAISVGSTRALENAGLKSDQTERDERLEMHRRLLEDTRVKHRETLRGLADR
jgi:hypothetical protein